jgi:YVTN family beta-propeller protein
MKPSIFSFGAYSRPTKFCLSGILLFSLGICAHAYRPVADAPYHEVARFEVGGEGGWDYLTCDSANQRLFITRGSHVMVVSTESGKVIGDIPDTKGCHGVALAPKLNRGFVSAGGDNAVVIFDLKTLKTIDKVPVGQRPDAILFEPFTNRVFTFNAGSQDTTALDAATGKVVGTIPLGGKPEFAQSDGKGKLFVNIEDKSELDTIDPKALTILRHTPLAPGESPSGLAIDVKHHLLFSSCDNKYATVVDGETGKLVATPPIGDGPDAATFDPGTGLAFTSNGSGTLSIIKPGKTMGSFDVENVPTQQGARTMALDTATHRVYLVTAKFLPPQPGQRRPGMVPNSFVILVFGVK